MNIRQYKELDIYVIKTNKFIERLIVCESLNMNGFVISIMNLFIYNFIKGSQELRIL